MKNDTVIKVENVSKKFCKGFRYMIKYGFTDISKAILGLDVNSDVLRIQEFWALKNISFDIKRGDTVAIIGANGSGKSTLLKLLNGIFLPDKGNITVKGKVGALISAGAGFHPMLTGRENIFVNGSILGMSKREIEKKFDDIVDFAEIAEFLDAPVRNYSSGMYVRLGFSIALFAQPDIFLVDEILSVGDIAFQEKAIRKIKDLISEQKTIIFVSHNNEINLSLTKKAIYLKNGSIKNIGDTSSIIEEYIKKAG